MRRQLFSEREGLCFYACDPHVLLVDNIQAIHLQWWGLRFQVGVSSMLERHACFMCFMPRYINFFLCLFGSDRAQVLILRAHFSDGVFCDGIAMNNWQR